MSVKTISCCIGNGHEAIRYSHRLVLQEFSLELPKENVKGEQRLSVFTVSLQDDQMAGVVLRMFL